MNKSEVLNFGKYKGKSIAEVMETDPSYIGWCLEQGMFGDLDKGTKARARCAKQESDEICSWALLNGYF